MVTNDVLEAHWNGEGFEPCIRHIRFPRFKSVADGTRLEFQFPITALVGANGTNKSSILRAIQGCPDYYNVGNYWFSTNLDPISSDDRHRFIHGYRLPSGGLAESIKTRIKRTKNPDYFEPARPATGDGMIPVRASDEIDDRDAAYRTLTRWKAINKRVVHFNFRHEIPAFDAVFYVDEYSDQRDGQARRLFLRKRSKHVSSAFSESSDSHLFYRKERIIQRSERLGDMSIEWVSRIVGREYDDIRILKHRYYDVTGTTILLRSKDSAYSEAFAGSGEYAVVIMVHKIMTARPKTLVLLDEPEVSLHPGAQRELMQFLRVQAISNRHQIVMATHSPEMISSLPPKAIKVLELNPVTHRVDLLSQEAIPREAFRRLGSDRDGAHRIYVEDRLAVQIVRLAVKSLGEGVFNSVEVISLGGAATICTKYLPIFALTKVEALVFLDGDQSPTEPLNSSGEIPNGRVLAELEDKIGLKRSHLLADGGNDPESNLVRNGRTVLEWANRNLKYLPGNTPEELALQLIGETDFGEGAKGAWIHKTRQSLGALQAGDPTSEEILHFQRTSLGAVDLESEPLIQIKNVVREFIERSND